MVNGSCAAATWAVVDARCLLEFACCGCDDSWSVMVVVVFVFVFVFVFVDVAVAVADLEPNGWMRPVNIPLDHSGSVIIADG